MLCGRRLVENRATAASILRGVLDALWTGVFPIADGDAWTINELRAALAYLGVDWQPPEGEE